MKTLNEQFERDLPKIFEKYVFEKILEEKYCSPFFNKLYSMITNASFYYLHDNSSHYRPDQVPSVDWETSPQRRNDRVQTVWSDLDHKFGLDNLKNVYNFFEDDRSKDFFLRRVLNAVYNVPLTRFPLFYYPFDEIEKIEKLADKNEVLSLWGGIIQSYKYNLRDISIDLEFWGNTDGIFIEFILDQYRYRNIVMIEDGDTIIDGGACYGDTALHFASQASGDIYSFEFMKENCEVFLKNLQLNPQYKKKIHLIKAPLGAKSNERSYATFNGPGTSISSQCGHNSSEFRSISIDDFVKKKNIPKIDFIKLDVEGSEENVLKGATETIKKFKPKLAICAYHKTDDLLVLPKLIKQLNPEYALYLDHYTINYTETVLYACPKK